MPGFVFVLCQFSVGIIFYCRYKPRILIADCRTLQSQVTGNHQIEAKEEGAYSIHTLSISFSYSLLNSFESLPNSLQPVNKDLRI